MPSHRNNRVFPVAEIFCCCALIYCARLVAEEAPLNSAPATAAGPAAQPASQPPEDILDRLFAPLDKAVADVNRDINSGDDSESPEVEE
jgi:hypothetical protein